MMKHYKTLSLALAIALLLTLAVSLLHASQQRAAIQMQHQVIRLKTAYDFMRDVYLKGEAENRPYDALVTYSEFLHFEGENEQAVVALIQAVRSHLSPQSPYLDELSPKIDALVVYVEYRDGAYQLVADVDAINALTAEIYAQPIS